MAYLDNVYAVVQIAPTGIPTYVRLSQNENGRVLNFAVSGDALPAGSTVALTGTKPDGAVYSASGTLADNVATFNEDEQLTAVAGEWDAKLEVTNSGNLIATGRIKFVIDADPSGGNIPSDSQLDGYIAEMLSLLDAGKAEAYGSPLVASTVAGMTDQSRVYVYTGSETGYTAGNWYYWNGSAWTSGGVYNAVAVSTDTTLSIAGKAADAKATGDALDELKDDLEQINPGLSSDAKAALLACFSNCAWSNENGQTYYNALSEALYSTEWIVTNTLTNCTSSNSASSVTKGGSYTAVISANAGYTLTGATVVVTMNGVDITSIAYSNGTIQIASVTGNVTITVTAVALTVTSLSAVYTQSKTIYTDDSLDDLTSDLVVTATFSNSSTSVIPSTDYTLSGTLTAGLSTITVTYRTATATFSVTVSASVPSGYTRLQYVEANGNQYVSIGVNETQVKSAVYKFSVTDETKTLDGAHILSSQNTFFPCPKTYYETKQLFYARGGSSGGVNYAWDEGVQYLIDAWKTEGDSIYVNGSLLASSMSQGSSSSSSNTFTVFTYGGNTSATKYRFCGRLYEMRIYNSSGNLVRNLIPAKNSSNVAGLYDTVGSTFYTSATGTALVAGGVA